MSRRKHPRSLAELTAREVEPARATPYPLRDIGLGGAFLLGCRWTVGSRHLIVIRHGRTAVTLTAEVLRRDPAGTALRFENVGPQVAARLRELLIAQVYAGAGVDEQRHAPRVRAPTPVMWKYAHAQYRTELDNLSMTGAAFAAQHPPPIGTELYVYLPTFEGGGAPPTVKEIHGCKAHVVRHTPRGFAVTFMAVSDEFRRVVLQLRNHSASA